MNLLRLGAGDGRDTAQLPAGAEPRSRVQRAGEGRLLKFTADEVLFVELKNRPGALAKAVEKLARAASASATRATASSRTRPLPLWSPRLRTTWRALKLGDAHRRRDPPTPTASARQSAVGFSESSFVVFVAVALVVGGGIHAVMGVPIP